MKLCKKCGSVDLMNDGRCRPCRTEYMRKYSSMRYITNKESIRDKHAEYYLKNKEAINKKRSEKYFENPEEIKKRSKDWYENNKEKVIEYREKNKEKRSNLYKEWSKKNRASLKERMKSYRIENAQKIISYNQNYRSKKRANGGVLSRLIIEKLFKLQRGKCACCGLPLGDNYHLDHIMPISLGGKNIDENVQLLRQRCNNQKGAKHPIDFMQSRGFLL